MNIAKVLSAFVGVMIVIGSLGMVGAGVVALTVDDSDGYLTAGPVRVATDAAALVGDDLDIFLDHPVVNRIDFDRIGARLDIDSRNGKDVFVGIGPAADLDRYLADVRYASVEFSGDDVVVIGHDGIGILETPRDQSFWVADAIDGALTWDVENGRWAVGIFNSDGSPGIDVDVTAAARVPFIRPIGIALAIAGLIGLAVGITLTYLGVRSTPTRSTTPADVQEAVPQDSPIS